MEGIRNIYVKELDNGKTIRVCDDGIRISFGSKSMYYRYDWEELTGIRNLKARVKRLNEKGIDIDSDIRLEYPENLFKDMGYGLEGKFEIEGVPYYHDVDEIMERFDERLDSCGLLEREMACIRLYYRELMTLEQVGRELGVSRERARQMLTKALRKIRHPRNMRKIMGIRTFDYEEAVNEAIRKRVEERWDEIMSTLPEKAVEFYERHKDDETIMNAVSCAKEDMPIDDLDLSVRSYNCLKRFGFHKVSDLLPIIGDDEKMLRIRNLGRKSLREIRERLMAEGFEWKDSGSQGC